MTWLPCNTQGFLSTMDGSEALAQFVSSYLNINIGIA